MRKVCITRLWLAVFLGLFPACAYAYGFEPVYPVAPLTRAAEVYSAPGGTPCSLEGRLIAQIPGRRDLFIFQDSSGKVPVYIRKSVFGDFTVTPGMLIQLNGVVQAYPWQPNEVKATYVGIIGPAASFGID